MKYKFMAFLRTQIIKLITDCKGIRLNYNHEIRKKLKQGHVFFLLLFFFARAILQPNSEVSRLPSW